KLDPKPPREPSQRLPPTRPEQPEEANHDDHQQGLVRVLPRPIAFAGDRLTARQRQQYRGDDHHHRHQQEEVLKHRAEATQDTGAGQALGRGSFSHDQRTRETAMVVMMASSTVGSQATTRGGMLNTSPPLSNIFANRKNTTSIMIPT